MPTIIIVPITLSCLLYKSCCPFLLHRVAHIWPLASCSLLYPCFSCVDDVMYLRAALSAYRFGVGIRYGSTHSEYLQYPDFFRRMVSVNMFLKYRVRLGVNLSENHGIRRRLPSPLRSEFSISLVSSVEISFPHYLSPIHPQLTRFVVGLREIVAGASLFSSCILIATIGHPLPIPTDSDISDFRPCWFLSAHVHHRRPMRVPESWK